ncbi:MAG: polysaccharide deacetylase family protein [candidate division Zixibacteria bacterium]|nr:polysaccharide deacetylase family protein [candidate division Zixibacteria bacterium]
MAPSDRNRSQSQDRSTPVVLVFHKLQASFSFGVNNFSPKRFERLLTWLELLGYDLRLGERTAGQRLICTFDDGYRHLADVLPMFIERFGIRPVLFVPTGWIGKANRWDYSYWLRATPHLERRQIRELANAGVIFGSHGHTHTDLTAVSSRRMQIELRQSREMLSDLAAQRIQAISYPFGRCDQAVLEAVEWAGYTDGFTMRWPTPNDSKLAQGRIPVYGYDSPLSIQHKLGDGILNKLERVKATVTNRLSAGTILLNRLRRLD